MSILNVISLVFGIIALIIPFVGQASTSKIILSFSLSLTALCCQLGYQTYLVSIEDWTALADTTGSVMKAAITLVVLAIIANIWCFMKMNVKKDSAQS